MTLNEDLAHWLRTRPDWQKNAVAGFCRNRTLSAEDVSKIADQLIAGTYPVAVNIEAADIPGSTAAGDPVGLAQISGVEGVNALAGHQTLSFGTAGLTIAFGNNASGKSGYARVIRKAVTARVKTAQLLRNVFSDVDSAQEAKLDYRVGVKTETWSLGDPQSADLSRVRFYDEDCGDAYVTTASEVNYRPSALTVLDQLSEACEAVAAELTRRLGLNQDERPRLPTLNPGTRASAFLSNISATTSEEAIEEATNLEDDHDAQLARQLAEEARLKGSDPTKEKDRLAALGRDWSTVGAHAETVEAALGDDKQRELLALQERVVQLQHAARIASARTFDSEPLPGVGSETWRALWEAARKFSLTDAYQDRNFPVTGGDAVCVLCQQPLTEPASDRLSRFEAFVTDTTSRDADRASKELAMLRDHFAELQTLPVAVSAAINRLQDAGEDVQSALEWFDIATHVAAAAVAWLDGKEDGDLPALADSIMAQADARARVLTTEARDIDASTFTQTLNATSKNVIELQDAKKLSDAKAAIKAEVVRLTQRKKIEDARRLAATNAITTKRGELAEVHVTAEIRDHFTRETERLGLDHVTLNRTGRGRDSALQHRPSLLGSRRTASVEEVLSEGEQTALGLAGFLTEVEFDESLSSIVLDDPVSSLDSQRRSKVAERLVELASRRQVIIFTHEITFVNALMKAARSHSVATEARSIQRLGRTKPGLVKNKLPWTVKDVPQRIGDLEADLARLKKTRESLSEDEYAKQIAQIAGRLSETLERAINLHIVNELVDRGTNEVHPLKLKILPKFTQADHDEFQAAYTKVSSWASRHDNAPEENYVAPRIDELCNEVSWLRGWHARIASYVK